MIQSITLLLVAMLSIQGGASFAKMLFPEIGPGGLTALRLFFSALMLFLAARGWRHLNFYKFHWKGLALYGASLGLMNLTFYYALKLIPLGLAVALEFTGPLMVAVLSSRRALDYIWVLLATIGIVLCLPFEGLHTRVHLGGVGLALIAGLFWALYIVFGKKISDKGSSLQLTSGAMIWGAIAVVPWGIAVSEVSSWSSKIWLQGILIAFFTSALPYTLEMMALKKIPTKTFGVLMSMEPVMASLVGFIVLSEKLTWIQQLAIACVVLATFGVSMTHKEPPPIQS